MSEPQEPEAQGTEPVADTTEEPKKQGPSWEHKTEFGINTKMREVIGLTISAVESEVKVLKRKLEKLQYGS
jgi:hypothetical protein